MSEEKKYYCPTCKKELNLVPGGWLFCETHGQVGNVSTFGKEWHNIVAEDAKNEYWCKDIIDGNIPIISEEYRRLIEFIAHKEIYGAFLQLKDVLEEILKMPILILMSYIYKEKATWDENKKNIMIEILQKPLSLGDWKTIGDKLKKVEIGNEGLKDIKELLNKVMDIYNRGNDDDIVNWRNEKIGHGALSPDIDKLGDDIKRFLIIIKKHFNKCKDIYKNIKININKGKITFTYDDLSFQLEPFFKIMKYNNKEEIGFFDTYKSKKKLTDVLYYTKGDKKNTLIEEINNIYSILEISKIEQAGDSAESDVIQSKYIKLLDEISNVDDFLKPDYFVNEVKTFIEKNKKGIMLLQSNGGMGKSTFVRSIDDFSHQYDEKTKKALGDSIVVRTYYIDDVCKYKVGYFTDDVSDILRKLSEDNIFKGVKDYEIKQYSTKEDFAKSLNYFKNKYATSNIGEKLLFIIDAIDEIPGGKEDKSIFDFIPDSSLLAYGVYILLTCRVDTEISEYTKSNISKIKFDKKVKISKENESYVNTLKRYIKKEITKEDSSADYELYTHILDKIDYRFVYLKFVKMLIEANKLDKVGISKLLKSVEIAEEVVNKFFSVIEQRYGEKYFNTFKKILLIIATAYESLTEKQLIYLFECENNITFRLLYYFADVSVFLKKERDYRGNLLSIFHESIIKILKEGYTDDIKSIIEEYIKRAKDLLEREDTSVYSKGELYLLAYVVMYAKEYLGNILEYFDNVDAYKLSAIAFDIDKKGDLDNIKLNRIIDLYTSSLIIFEELDRSDKLFDRNSLAGVYMNRGVAYQTKGELDRALDDFRSSKKICMDFKNVNRLNPTGEQILKTINAILKEIEGNKNSDK